MVEIDIADKTDKEVIEYLETILSGELIIDDSRDISPAYQVYRLYQYQSDGHQKERIKRSLHEILVKNFVHVVVEKLDEESNRLLGDLAFLGESLRIDQSYRVLRSLLDRGTLSSTADEYFSKDTERKILRALMSLQTPKLLSESVWQLYWESQDHRYWDLAFLGLRKSSPSLAIDALGEAYDRWKGQPEGFDFPEALWEILNGADKNQLRSISKTLDTMNVAPSDLDLIADVLKKKGLSETIMQMMPWGDMIYIMNEKVIWRNREFHIYHHRDLDGIGCAVLWSLFLTHKYKHHRDKIETVAVDFCEQDIWAKRRLEKPAAVFDFLYHIDALVYYDHHQRRFMKEEFEKDFNRRHSEQHICLKRGESSAVKLVFHAIGNDLAKLVPHRYKKLEAMVAQIDRIDAARYRDVYEWYNCEFDLAKINLVLHENLSADLCTQLVKDLIDNDFDRLIARDDYKRLYEEAKHNREERAEAISKILRRQDSVILYDSVSGGTAYERLFPYVKYEDASFVVGIYEKLEVAKGSKYEVSVGRNPWTKPERRIDIGQLCMSLGGGGNQDVGGISLKTYEEACDIARRVVGVLLSK